MLELINLVIVDFLFKYTESVKFRFV